MTATETRPVGSPSRASSSGVRGVFVANLVAQGAIIVTGATVRITGSGLGCPTWPQCVEGSYVPTARQEQSWHKFVEFGNRSLTFVLVLLAIAALVAALWDRRRQRAAGLEPRGVVLALAYVPLIGTFAQALLGGVTVRTGLSPVTVTLHFLVSIVLVAGTVALVVRSGDRGDEPITWLVPRPVVGLSWALVGVTGLVVVLGTLVTGSGPYSGDANAELRYGFDPRTVAWLHADVVLLFIGLTIGLLVALAIVRGPARAQRRTWLLLGIATAQGLVGYTQYFAGMPEALVMVHMIGAVSTWIAVLFVPPALRTRG